MATAQQVGVPQMGATTVVQNETPHRSTPYKKVFLGLGITEVVMGVITIIFGVVALLPSGYTGNGIWMGAWYIIVGGVGIATGVTPTNCNVIGGMVLAILGSLVAFGSMCYEGALSALKSGLSCIFGGCAANQVGVALHAVLAVLSFAGFVILIVHASYSCCGNGGCCGNQGSATTTTAVAMSSMPAQAPQMGQMQHQQAYGYPMVGVPPQQHRQQYPSLQENSPQPATAPAYNPGVQQQKQAL